jgi:hypothetical protein
MNKIDYNAATKKPGTIQKGSDVEMKDASSAK